MKNKTEEKTEVRPVIKALAMSAVIAVALMLLLALIQAAAAQIFTFSESTGKIVSYIVWAICSALGGYICLSALNSRGILYGTVEGIVIFALCLIIGLISTGSIGQFSKIWINLVISVLGSMVGGVIGVNRRK